MTYEEFLKENNTNFITYINFTGENTLILNVTANGNPNDYIDVAKKATSLNYLIVPKTESKGYYESLRVFVENCRNEVEIEHNDVGRASKDEFLQGEEIINNLLKDINPNWNTKQKLAYVHYKIGALVSYIPDFVFNQMATNSPVIVGTGNLWKSLANGNGICNGITAIQQNVLARLGIKTTELSSGVHSYLPTETEDGNIITDATWDLIATLYKAKPMYFGVTYEELCKKEENIAFSHRLKNPPQNVIKINDYELREIFHSIGIIGDDRKFPLPILEKTRIIGTTKEYTIDEKIKEFFEMFIRDFKKEASHLSETRNMIQQCLEELGVRGENVTTKFVYPKNDMQCVNPVLAIHIDIEECKDIVYTLNKEALKIDTLKIEDFDKYYKVHRFDTALPFWKKFLQIQEKTETNNQIGVFNKSY